MKTKVSEKDHCKSGLFTMKLHLLDHLRENLAKFQSVLFLDSTHYETFNAVQEAP